MSIVEQLLTRSIAAGTLKRPECLTTTMSLSRLILFPKDPQLQLEVAPLMEQLQQRQIADSQLPAQYGAESYLVGERFFDGFLFLGCSPAIELAPTDSEAPFCYLQVEVEAVCQLVAGGRVKAVCKACKQRYQPLEVVTEGEMPMVRCHHCGEETAANEVAWRKSAALSATRLSLWNIFEGEAVPSDQLLNLLAVQSGVQWTYAYIN